MVSVAYILFILAVEEYNEDSIRIAHEELSECGSDVGWEGPFCFGNGHLVAAEIILMGLLLIFFHVIRMTWLVDAYPPCR